MTVNQLTAELTIRGDLDQLRDVLAKITAERLTLVPPVVVTETGRCGKEHPRFGWICALEPGHTGAHDPEPHLPVPETAGEVEDAPAKQAPANRGEAVERPASPVTDPAAESQAPAAGSPTDTGGESVPPTSPPAGPRAITRPQARMLHASFGSLGYQDAELGGREARLQVTSAIVGRDVESSNDLTVDEAKACIDTLARCKTREDVENVLVAIEEHRSGR